MKVAYKRGRFPAKTKKRLKYLADELKEQKRLHEEMEHVRKYNPYYRVAVQIRQACDWYVHDGVDIDTIMETIERALFVPVHRASNEDWTKSSPYDRGMAQKQPPKNYEEDAVIVRHTIREHDSLTANLMYLIDNTVGLWYDGYYGDKLAINLLDDYAATIISAFMGRRR
ncbi:MAG: hypothetical protein IT328_06025 [Caldilineaceae bacterium]|nr:hypothetical protein [Caldilineaceae bacterium]